MTAPQKIGIYIHIPYCLQKCPYCDFAKYEVGEIPPYLEYTKLLKKEIDLKAPLLKNKRVKTLYFGGGTPSLLPVDQLCEIKEHLQKYLDFSELEEFTLECNPGTLTAPNVAQMKEIGINRWSVGAQTFQDTILKKLGRKHTAQDTRDTLSLLNSMQCNYTLDLMYALPGQSYLDFSKDIENALEFKPKHISLYYLTLPEHHFLNKNRPLEEEQLKMFETLEEKLLSAGIQRYEISNFAVPSYESKHNSLYWTDAEYMGFGLSAHSYLKELDSGVRFWNSRTYSQYQKHLEAAEEKQDHDFLPKDRPYDFLPKDNVEPLRRHEAMTDYCHTSLRRMVGLSVDSLLLKFPKEAPLILKILRTLAEEDLVEASLDQSQFRLSFKGKCLPNLVFEKLTFLKEDLVSIP